MIYANDREPRHSSIYAQYGRDGQSITIDPTISGKLEPDHGDSHGGGHAGVKQPDDSDGHSDEHAEDSHGEGAPVKEKGHPLRHVFTRAIPTAQCMNCHMHQPNIFLNSYLGYTMWDYESDAPAMWPEEQRYPTAEEVRDVLDRNPEGAAPKGNWADLDFTRNVYDLNPELNDTQFADYHGHGWNFRGIFKRDREGNLLDENGDIVDNDDPEKWRREGEGKFVDPGVNPGKAAAIVLSTAYCRN